VECIDQHLLAMWQHANTPRIASELASRRRRARPRSNVLMSHANAEADRTILTVRETAVPGSTSISAETL
jgi:hypothetical protein